MLGAGVYQVPGILKVQEQYIEVISCSYRADDLGMALANHAENVDIADKEAVLCVAKDYRVDAIMTMCSDVGVPALGYVSDHLGLPGISQQTALMCSNKYLMKQAFINNGVDTPSFVRAESTEQAVKFADQVPGPSVVKAVDASGSRGIVRVATGVEITNAFAAALSCSKEHFVIVEEAIDGLEFGSQALVIDGQVIFNFCHNDVVTSNDVSTPVAHSYPFRGEPDLEQKALTQVRKAVKALRISNAQLNCDFIQREDAVYVLEIAARMGGTSLPQLTTNYTGLDWIQIGIDLAFGQPDIDMLSSTPIMRRPTASSLLTACKTGTIRSITVPEWVHSDPDVTHFVVEAQIGDNVNRFRIGPDRIGEIVTVGDTLAEAEEVVRRALLEIHINIE